MGLVAEWTSHTWTCPACGRRVPLRVDACHCGATRAPAEERTAAAAPRPRAPVARPRLPPLPADVKAFVVGAALVLVAGLFWLVLGPSRPAAVPAILGYADAGPPPVRSTAARPPFKLPWWK